MTDLQYRVLQLSRKYNLAHIGSCLGMLPILEEIYSQRKPDEPVILSNGHAGLALYTILEVRFGKDAEDLLNRHGVHPTKNLDDGLYCSTGHLGQGVTVAVGRALADRNRNVWVTISDGECGEGVVTSALRLAGRANLTNLKVYLHWNGFAALRQIAAYELDHLRHLCPWLVVRGLRPEGLGIPFLKGQDAHYHVMTNEDWAWVEAQRGEAKTITCPDCGGSGEDYMALHSPPILIGCSRCKGTGRCSV